MTPLPPPRLRRCADCGRQPLALLPAAAVSALLWLLIILGVQALV